MTLLPIVLVMRVVVALWEISNLSMIIKTIKTIKTMKKVIFATCALAIGLWSCSSSDDTVTPPVTPPSPNGYVDVTIGVESDGLKSIVGAGGATSWDITDKVKIMDVDGVEEVFNYAATAPQSSAQFSGKLKAGQGKQTYNAYHVAENANTFLRNGSILVTERKDLEVTDNGTTVLSAIFGTYCPMVATPFQFDANDKNAKKVAQFYHLGTMIEARVTLRSTEDSQYLNKTVDKIVFQVKATGSKPFNTKMELDLSKLTTTSNILDLKGSILPSDPSAAKTDLMSTTINMPEKTIKSLIDNSGLKFLPVPIFALPTTDKFNYTATITFFYKGAEQLKMEGSSKSEAEGLNPGGLNILDFAYDKIK